MHKASEARNRMGLRLLLAALLICPLALPATTAAVAPPAATPLDTPVDALWRQLFARHDIKAWQAGNELVNELYGDGNGADAALCAKREQALARALRDNPVSLALWDVGYRCATVAGDSALAAQRADAMAALLKQSLAARPIGEEEAPIRIGTPADAFALVNQSHQHLLYAYYDVFSNNPPVTLHVALWDETSRRERWLSFDFTDSLAQLSNEPLLHYPVGRLGLGLQTLKLTAADAPQSYSAQALRLFQLRQTTVGQPVVEAYLAESRRGNYLGSYALGYVCLATHTYDCGKQAVDALLPWAEKHAAQAMLFLARAYASGSGVKADRDAAMKLLLAADARLGDGRGLRWYAQNLIDPKAPGLIDAQVWQRLQQRAVAGDVPAQLVLVAHQLQSPGATLDAAQRAYLEHAVAAGYRQAQFVYATVLRQEHRPDLAQPWLRKAADAGVGAAEWQLADDSRAGRNQPVDPVQARYWYERAATHGSTGAMSYLAYRHQYFDPAPDHLIATQRWLQSAVLLQDERAIEQLAYLYITGGKGLDGDATLGLKMLRGLAARPARSGARRTLALLLADGENVPRDLAQAQRLLSQDADKGVTDSQVSLGNLLLRQDNPQRDPAKGMQWLRKAAAAGDADALTALGNAYANGAGGKLDMHVALDWWRKAAAKGSTTSNNNLAWWYCTSADPAIRDPAAGMPFAQWLEEKDDLDPASRDTVAACHAAQGEFDRAVEQEELAMVDVRRIQGENWPSLPRFRERIARYRRHQVYIEPAAPPASPQK